MVAGLPISVVGSIATASSQTTRTISVNPTAVRNLVLMGIIVESATTTTAVSAISGGNCAWSLIANLNVSSRSDQLALWMGIASATGASTATVTTTGASGTVWVDLCHRQYTCTGLSAATQWQIDGTAGTKLNTSSTTVTYPTEVPSDTGRMYAGFSVAGTDANTTGQTAGYTLARDAVNNAFIHNASVSGSQAPTNTLVTASTSGTIGVLIYATNPTAPGKFLPFFSAPGHHEDDLLERRPSGLYVQRRKIAGVRPNGGRDRVLVRA